MMALHQLALAGVLGAGLASLSLCRKARRLEQLPDMDAMMSDACGHWEGSSLTPTSYAD